MSLFGSLLGDFDDDAIFGHHMRQMRQMNNFMGMGSLMPDPFNMLTPFDNRLGAPVQRNNNGGGLFGFPGMPNMNRLLNASDTNGASYCSSSVYSMSSGPDGRQVYQATSSTKTGPGGVRETRKTVEDSRSGLKKMAIGHHIGDRSHIIQREQNVRSGQQEEHQEYVNLEEEEAEDFNREFTHKVRGATSPREIMPTGQYASPARPQRNLPAIAAPPASADKKTSSTTTTATTSPSSRRARNIQKVGSRRPLRTPTSSPLVLTSPTTSMHPHPYNASAARRNFRAKHAKQQQSAANLNNSETNENKLT